MSTLSGSNIKHRTLGKSGYSIGEIGLGAWQLGGDFGPIDEEHSLEILSKAYQMGVDFIDTADVYGGGLSEKIIGKFIADLGQKPYVATKLGRSGEPGWPQNFEKDVMRSHIEGSLSRLGVSCLDLIQLHCIPTDVLKEGTVFQYLDDFKSEGLINAYGTSVETVEEAKISITQPGVTSVQIIFNMFRQHIGHDVFDLAEENDVGIIVRLPLASGLLTGKFNKETKFAEQDHRNYNKDGEMFSVGETFSGIPFDKALELVEELEGILDTQLPLSQVALRWILDHKSVKVIIPGASKPEQVIANVAAGFMEPFPVEMHQKLYAWYEDKVRGHIRGVM